LADVGKYEEAIKCFDKALEMDPYNEDAKIAREKIFDF
jgi:tetratricopeptide (TPR) repeat protein